MGKVSFNGVRVGVKRHELWFERNMYNVHTGSCKKNKKIKKYQMRRITNVSFHSGHNLIISFSSGGWWEHYTTFVLLSQKKKKKFSQKMWWKRKCVKIRFVWKRWCIKAFDFLKTCCGIYILYDWTPARLKRMCDLLFSALLIVSQAFTGVSCPTIIAFVSTHGSSFTYILGSQMLRGSRGKGTDGETIINLKHWNNIFH